MATSECKGISKEIGHMVHTLLTSKSRLFNKEREESRLRREQAVCPKSIVFNGFMI